jgi:hypothetical protein
MCRGLDWRPNPLTGVESIFVLIETHALRPDLDLKQQLQKSGSTGASAVVSYKNHTVARNCSAFYDILQDKSF